jgi:nucleoside-diphosphate-sugar epimerase
VNVLVTGASGFLGSHIAEQLAAEGHAVRLLLRRTSSREWLQFPYDEATGDVTDPASLGDAVVGVDAVIHSAGLVKARSEREFASVNAKGTSNLLRAIEEKAPELKRFVYVSSLAAHGPSPDGKPRPAEAPPKPITAYGRTKLAGEEATRSSAVAARSVIIRPPVIYGPRDPALVPFFKLAKLRVAPLLMGGRNRISAVYGPDAARAVVLAATAEAEVAGKIYTLDDGNVYTWHDLLSAVEGAVGRTAIRLSCPRWTFEFAATASEAFGAVTRRAVSLTRDKVREMAQRHWACDSAAIRRDLGWSSTVGIEEGARLTGEWYVDRGWI